MPNTNQEPLLQFFSVDNLPPLFQAAFKPFADLATKVATDLPRNPERTVALRKLLESRDAAVRALLMSAAETNVTTES